MDTYVLITPARNEEAYIEKTIRAVLSQSVPPKRWIIISDGSTDRTDAIVGRFAREHDFMELIRLESGTYRDFSSKVNAFNLGYDRIRNEAFDFLGILDADVTFDERYFENILTKFREDTRLGIAGGRKYDRTNGRFRKIMSSRDSVAGPFQLFRRRCFEETGGFTPIPEGGEDAVIEAAARMRGWKVRTFSEYIVYHHRRTGTASFHLLRGRFRDGVQDYIVGYHPLFELFRCVYRAIQPPYIVGSIVLLAGYSWAAVRRRKRPVSEEFVNYLRSEQLSRIAGYLKRSRSLNPDRVEK